MRSLGANAAFAAAAIAGTAALSFAINGLATAPLPGRTPLASATAAELTPFTDCDELLDWYVEAALPQVGPYGFNQPMAYDVFTRAEAGAPTMTEESPRRAVRNSDTGTNVQEAGVDEPDRAKTDGSLVVHISEGVLVVTDVTGDSPRELGTLKLPDDLMNPEVLLVGDTVLVFASDGYSHGRPIPLMESSPRIGMPFGAVPETTRLLHVTITDPGDPALESDQRIDGRLVSARQYSDVVRLVTSAGLPPLDFVFPNRDRDEREATAANREVVRESGIEDWLPGVRTTEEGDRTPLLDCADVRHPEERSGFGTISVLTFDADTPTSHEAIGVTAAGDLVYSSTDRLYVATISHPDVIAFNEGDKPQPNLKPTEERRPTTAVHAFALDGPDTTYLASGEVTGTVRDRWSMDEYAGHLRVATALGRDSWDPTENGITVLDESLRVVGEVTGLGPDEDIKSVRWFDDLAVVVTFRQIDPLYTVDLSDPTDPQVLGELKIPGFSEYLHPIGDGRLLGIGQHATDEGQTLGGQVASFDLSDLSDPRRIDTLSLGQDTQITAAYDPRGFSYLPDLGIALMTRDDYLTGHSSMVAVSVDGDGDGSLDQVDEWRLGGWDGAAARALPLGGSLVALVGGDVELIDLG